MAVLQTVDDHSLTTVSSVLVGMPYLLEHVLVPQVVTGRLPYFSVDLNPGVVDSWLTKSLD